MSQRFIKGNTNNHLTWVMVDATDFATPESALSAATKIKIYGKLKSATGVNFVSSGTGSLTNDIQHVGASALGIYTIALAKADLSDASAAWYDQYIISLSATGAAYQAIIVDGGIMESYLSAAQSDALSAAVQINSRVLLAESAASDAASAAAQANSRVLLVQSRLSDFNSAYTSDMSDVISALTALSALVSDAYSAAVVAQSIGASDMSDLRSAIAAGPAATITASDISDIASAVWAAKYTANSAASSFGSLFSDVYSRVRIAQSAASDAASGVTVLLSRITSVTATSSDLVSKIWSDFTSKMGATPSQLYSVVLVGTSAASDAASAAAQANSRVLLVQSRLSDLNSVYTSDISDIRSMLTALSDQISNVDSAVNSQYSDLASKIGAITVTITASDISDIASATAAAVGFTPSAIAARVWSDYQSKVGASPSQVYSALLAGASALTDTRAEPGQGTPAATTDALSKLDYLYKAWRNRTTQTATQYSLYADDATTVDQKATFSDNGTTADRAEVTTGP